MKLTVRTDGFEGYAQRAQERAGKLARGENVAAERTINFESAQDKPGFAESFGLWKEKAVDGVEYQKRLRDDGRVEELLLEGLSEGKNIPVADALWKELKSDARKTAK